MKDHKDLDCMYVSHGNLRKLLIKLNVKLPLVFAYKCHEYVERQYQL